MRNFFSSLRFKLTMTYTLVTVAALLALEILVFLLFALVLTVSGSDRREYIGDVVFTLFPQANDYLLGEEPDLNGLQNWLEGVYASGYASEEPRGFNDSPAAPIASDHSIYILSPDGDILIQVPDEHPDQGKGAYLPPSDGEVVLQNALSGIMEPLDLYTPISDGTYFLAFPIMAEDTYTSQDLLGVITINIEPAPSMLLRYSPIILAVVVFTGVFLLIGVAPFGALFGFIMSRGLTRRLNDLTRASNTWSSGDFSVTPSDRSKDEIGQLGNEMKRMAAEIQQLMEERQELATLEERSRLARDLHDTVKQQNFATLMQIRAAKNLVDENPEASREHLDEAEDLVKASQKELGLLITELRPPAQEDQRLDQMLKNYIDQWSQQTRIKTCVQVEYGRSLSPQIENSLYRVIQEAMANIARHSQATEVTLNLACNVGDLKLEIMDNGLGFDTTQTEKTGFGLQSMRQRIEQIGGTLSIYSDPGEGTKISVAIPTAEQRNGEVI